MISIAIDGPSGAGKSSLAKALAKDLGYVYVDTGAMYRSIGLYAVRAGVDPHDADAVAALLPQVKLGIRLIDGAQHIYLNGEDVSTAIRAEEIGMAASAVAAHPAVRSFLLDTQRGLAESQNILMDGRDIGTVVLPNATVKIFLTASAEARAQRRAKELAEKGQPADFATVLADIRQRVMPVPFLHSFVSFSTVVVSPLPRSMETAPMQRRNQPASGFLNSSSLARMRSRFQSNIVIAIKTGSRLAMWFGAMT